MTFEDEVIQKTGDKLIKGQDYRDEVIKSINALFLDFAVDFFKNTLIILKYTFIIFFDRK